MHIKEGKNTSLKGVEKIIYRQFNKNYDNHGL